MINQSLITWHTIQHTSDKGGSRMPLSATSPTMPAPHTGARQSFI
uniref:Uncharacterized protein n=2 Tax=unclassified Caudoviricetes TaxID=2788787 RepID=A0A8S5LI58_9CAUD|nr:MAG TPA: hypothetical protein [Myoviridae sp. ctFCq8]DAF58478.1 MAG TPA: hypothetical protein [Myoviridae sp. ctLIM9]